MATTLTTQKINSMNVLVSSTGDVYTISANINIANNAVTNIEAGIVKQGDIQVANFADYGSLSLNYNGSKTDDEKQAILTAINTFENTVKTADITTLTTTSNS